MVAVRPGCSYKDAEGHGKSHGKSMAGGKPRVFPRTFQAPPTMNSQLSEELYLKRRRRQKNKNHRNNCHRKSFQHAYPETEKKEHEKIKVKGHIPSTASAEHTHKDRMTIARWPLRNPSPAGGFRPGPQGRNRLVKPARDQHHGKKHRKKAGPGFSFRRNCLGKVELVG